MDRRGLDPFDLAYRMPAPAAPVAPRSAPLGVPYLLLAGAFARAQGSWYIRRAAPFEDVYQVFKLIGFAGLAGAVILGVIAFAVGTRRAILFAVAGMGLTTLLAGVPEPSVAKGALVLGALAHGGLQSAVLAALGERLGRASVGERLVGTAGLFGLATLAGWIAPEITHPLRQWVGEYASSVGALVALVPLAIAGALAFLARGPALNDVPATEEEAPIDRKVAPLVLLALVGSGVLTLVDVARYTNSDLHLSYSWSRTLGTDLGAAALALFVGTLFTFQGRRTGLFRLAGIGLAVCAVAAVAMSFFPGALLFVELASEFATICLFTLASFGHGRTQGTIALTSFVAVGTVLNFLGPLVARAVPPFVTIAICALAAAAIAVFYFVTGNGTEERSGFDLTS